MDDTGRFFQRKAKGPEEIQSSAPFVVYIEKKDMTGDYEEKSVNMILL